MQVVMPKAASTATAESQYQARQQAAGARASAGVHLRTRLRPPPLPPAALEVPPDLPPCPRPAVADAVTACEARMAAEGILAVLVRFNG